MTDSAGFNGNAGAAAGASVILMTKALARESTRIRFGPTPSR